jgi:hypothetical protein
MIPYITLGVTLLSLAVTLFIAWCIAAPQQEEETHVMGFRYEPAQEEDLDGPDSRK